MRIALLALCAVACFAQTLLQQNYDARTYVFTRTNGSGASGNLSTAGAHTAVFTPCPAGINSTSPSNASVRISGGTGTAESVVLTSYSAGTGSCTVGLTTSNVHSGAWTVQSATAGIQEATQAAKAANGGVVVAPQGTYSLTAAVQLPSNVTLQGAGQGATVLKVANGALAGIPAWLMAGSPGSTAGSFLYCVICFAPAATYSVISDLTIDVNGANQSLTLFSQDITGYNCTNCVVSDVTVKNHQFGTTGSGIALWGHSPRTANANNLITRTAVIQQPNCSVPTAGGGYYIEGFMNRIMDTYAFNACDTDYVVADCTHCSVVNGNSDLGSGQSATPVFTVAGLYNTVSDSHCTASGSNSVASCFQADNGTNEITDGTVFMNNTADHCRGGFEINNVFTARHAVTNTVFSGGSSACTSGNNVGINAPATDVVITGMTLHDSDPSSGIGINLETATGLAVLNNINITGNVIDHNHFGIVVSSAVSDLIKNLNISDNMIGDQSASPVQATAIILGAGLATKVRIADNVFSPSSALAASNTWSQDSVVERNVGAVNLTWTASTLGSASTLGAGYPKYCTDCTTACVTGGTGRMAISNGSAWKCD